MYQNQKHSVTLGQKATRLLTVKTVSRKGWYFPKYNFYLFSCMFGNYSLQLMSQEDADSFPTFDWTITFVNKVYPEELSLHVAKNLSRSRSQQSFSPQFDTN